MHDRYNRPVPALVATVFRAAQASAKRGGLPDDAAHLYYNGANPYNPDPRWEIVDNYERYSNAILEYHADGHWTIRSMHSERKPQSISQSMAEENARLMFSDAPSSNRAEGAVGRLRNRVFSPGLDTVRLSRRAYHAKVKRMLKGLYSPRSAPTIIPMINDGYAMGRTPLHTARLIAGSYGWKG